MGHRGRIAELEAELKRIEHEMYAVTGDPANEPSYADWRRIERRKGLPRDAPERKKFKGSDAFGAAVLDAVEVRYLFAARRVIFAQLGLAEEPVMNTITVKDQPERLGTLVIVTYMDRLAAIDPRRWLDAIFTSERAEVWRLFNDPAKTVAKWLAKKAAQGQPWTGPGSPEEKAHRDAARDAALDEYHRLRKLMYPTKELREAARKQRAFTCEEVHATLAALEAYRDGEPPSVEEQVRTLDLSILSPIDAHLKLQALQAQARRLDTNNHFLPASMGGFLLPAEPELNATPQPPA